MEYDVELCKELDKALGYSKKWIDMLYDDLDDLRTIIHAPEDYKVEIRGLAQLFLQDIYTTLKTADTYFDTFQLLQPVYSSLKEVNRSIEMDTYVFRRLEIDLQYFLVSLNKLSKISLELLL